MPALGFASTLYAVGRFASFYGLATLRYCKVETLRAISLVCICEVLIYISLKQSNSHAFNAHLIKGTLSVVVTKSVKLQLFSLPSLTAAIFLVVALLLLFRVAAWRWRPEQIDEVGHRIVGGMRRRRWRRRHHSCWRRRRRPRHRALLLLLRRRVRRLV